MNRNIVITTKTTQRMNSIVRISFGKLITSFFANVQYASLFMVTLHAIFEKKKKTKTKKLSHVLLTSEANFVR